jgi:plastocyanin
MSGSKRWCARALGAVLAAFLLAPGGSAFAQGVDATVDMQGIMFAPVEMHVAPGATVLWTNSSTLQHTVTAEDGSFDSAGLDPGDTFTQVFAAPGTYPYFCVPHKSIGMTGVIVVDDPNAAAPAMVTQRTPDDYMPTEVD